jgi:hypothetical protein
MRGSGIMKLGALLVWLLTGFYLISAVVVGYRNIPSDLVTGHYSLVQKLVGAMPTVIPGVFAGFLLAGLGSYFAARSLPPNDPA